MLARIDPQAFPDRHAAYSATSQEPVDQTDQVSFPDWALPMQAFYGWSEEPFALTPDPRATDTLAACAVALWHGRLAGALTAHTPRATDADGIYWQAPHLFTNCVVG
jgi:hypothetical protein